MTSRHPILTLLTICLSFLSIQGCSNNSSIFSKDNLPLVHRIDVQQGNVINQDMLAKLKLGMEKKKVRFIMGTPLISDTFHNDRWDYIYTYQDGRKQREQRRITLFFKDELLARVEGDVNPARGVIPTDTRRVESVDVPPAAPLGLFPRVKEKLSFGKDKPKLDKKVDDVTSQSKEPISNISPVDLPEEPMLETTSEDLTSSQAIPAKEKIPEEKGFFGKLWGKLGGGDDDADPEIEPTNPVLIDPSDPDSKSEY